MWVLPQTVVEVIQRFQSEILARRAGITWIFLRFVLSIRHPFQPNVLNHWRISDHLFPASSGVAYLMILLSKGGRAVLLSIARCWRSISPALLPGFVSCAAPERSCRHSGGLRPSRSRQSRSTTASYSEQSGRYQAKSRPGKQKVETLPYIAGVYADSGRMPAAQPSQVQ